MNANPNTKLSWIVYIVGVVILCFYGYLLYSMHQEQKQTNERFLKAVERVAQPTPTQTP
jgi:cytoskeletal protein RodZ